MAKPAQHSLHEFWMVFYFTNSTKVLHPDRLSFLPGGAPFNLAGETVLFSGSLEAKIGFQPVLRWSRSEAQLHRSPGPLPVF
jgi:hypothetical protein